MIVTGKYAGNMEREALIDRVLSARTPAEIAAVTQELDDWIALHPDDKGILDAYEPLALFALEDESYPAVPPPVLVKTKTG